MGKETPAHDACYRKVKGSVQHIPISARQPGNRQMQEEPRPRTQNGRRKQPETVGKRKVGQQAHGSAVRQRTRSRRVLPPDKTRLVGNPKAAPEERTGQQAAEEEWNEGETGQHDHESIGRGRALTVVFTPHKTQTVSPAHPVLRDGLCRSYLAEHRVQHVQWRRHSPSLRTQWYQSEGKGNDDSQKYPRLLFQGFVPVAPNFFSAQSSRHRKTSCWRRPRPSRTWVDNMATTLSGRYTATKAGKKFISRIVSALRAKYIENSVRLGLASERLVYETALGSAEVPQRVVEAVAKLAGTKSTWI